MRMIWASGKAAPAAPTVHLEVVGPERGLPSPQRLEKELRPEDSIARRRVDPLRTWKSALRSRRYITNNFEMHRPRHGR